MYVVFSVLLHVLHVSSVLFPPGFAASGITDANAPTVLRIAGALRSPSTKLATISYATAWGGGSEEDWSQFGVRDHLSLNLLQSHMLQLGGDP